MFWRNKGQITIYMIVGVILLTMLIIISILTFTTSKSPIEDLGQGSAEYEQIKNFVGGCIQDTTEEGLEIMRLQGGFIYIPVAYDTIRLQDDKSVVYDRGFERIKKEKGNNTLAYWITKDDINFPSTDLMKRQLKYYLETKIIDCVQDFDEFEKLGYDVFYETPQAEIEFGNEVIVKMEFPIEARKGNSEVKIKSFEFKKNINMNRVHELALQIMAQEDLFGFLEKDTKRLISLYSGVDEEKLPPMTATITNTDCEYVTWEDEDVKERLKAILEKNVELIRVNGTKYKPVYGDNQKEQNFLNSFVHDFGIEDTDIEVSFDYDREFGLIDYDVSPNTGLGIQPPDRVRSTSVPLLPQFCTFNYDYKYDLEYPVIVTLKDMDSEKADSPEKGFEFRFPVMVYLCGNNERYCNPKVERQFNVDPTLDYLDTKFCEDKKNIIDIKVSDEYRDVSGVDIRFVCANANNDCYMGKTDENGVLSTYFPECYNGIVVLSKAGYGEKRALLSTESARSVYYKIEKERELTPEVYVVSAFDLIDQYKKGSISLKDIAEPLKAREDAVVMGTGPTQFSVVYPTDVKNINIAPGKYDIDIMLKANMRIKPSFIDTDEGQIEISFNPKGTGVYEGIWVTRAMPDIDWEVNYVDNEAVEFFVLTQFRPGDDVDTRMMQDSIFDPSDNIYAELIYSQDSVEGECVGQYKLTKVDGKNSDDLVAGPCELREEVFIPKEVYMQYMRPRLR